MVLQHMSDDYSLSPRPSGWVGPFLNVVLQRGIMAAPLMVGWRERGISTAIGAQWTCRTIALVAVLSGGFFLCCCSLDLPVSIGPATRCDATHSRWDVPKLLRYIKITCDVLRCIFQHVGIYAPDFGISQLFIIRFSNGLQYCDKDSIPFHVICDSKLSARFF